MKKILLLLFIIVSINSFAQFPATQSQGTVNTKVINNGGFQAMKGLINGVFADTTAANADYIDFYNGAQIYTRSDRNFWLRDSVLNSWVRMAKFSDVGTGSNFANTDLTQTAARTYAGAGFNYTLNNLGHWTFNMANGKNFDVNNAAYFSLNTTTNDFFLGQTGNAGVNISGDGASTSLTLTAGTSAGRRSTIVFGKDSMSFQPIQGKINIDSLRTGTGDDEVITWNAGMVRKMPTVKYNITSPQNGDILIYDAANSEWVNTPHSDSSFYLKEYDDLSELDASPYNAAIIEGRLWIYNRAASTWRRQAYDSTYTPSGPAVYFTDDFTGTNDTYINSRVTTTGSLTWNISASSTLGTKLYSPPEAIRAETQAVQISRYVVDVTHHDVDLRGTLSQVQASTPLVFLLLAFTDDNNFIQVNMVSGAITQTVASVPTSLYAGSGTSVANDIIRANLNGTTLTVYRNGVSLTSVSVSGALTGTKFGTYFFNDGGSGGSEITFIEGREAE